MAEKLMTYQYVESKMLQEIVEKIENIAVTANSFRGEVMNAYDRSDLAFLKRVSRSLKDLESAANILVENFIELENKLNTYEQEINGEDVDYGRKS